MFCNIRNFIKLNLKIIPGSITLSIASPLRGLKDVESIDKIIQEELEQEETGWLRLKRIFQNGSNGAPSPEWNFVSITMPKKRLLCHKLH